MDTYYCQQCDYIGSKEEHHKKILIDYRTSRQNLGHPYCHKCDLIYTGSKEEHDKTSYHIKYKWIGRYMEHNVALCDPNKCEWCPMNPSHVFTP